MAAGGVPAAPARAPAHVPAPGAARLPAPLRGAQHRAAPRSAAGRAPAAARRPPQQEGTAGGPRAGPGEAVSRGAAQRSSRTGLPWCAGCSRPQAVPPIPGTADCSRHAEPKGFGGAAEPTSWVEAAAGKPQRGASRPAAAPGHPALLGGSAAIACPAASGHQIPEQGDSYCSHCSPSTGILGRLGGPGPSLCPPHLASLPAAGMNSQCSRPPEAPGAPLPGA